MQYCRLRNSAVTYAPRQKWEKKEKTKSRDRWSYVWLTSCATAIGNSSTPGEGGGRRGREEGFFLGFPLSPISPISPISLFYFLRFSCFLGCVEDPARTIGRKSSDYYQRLVPSSIFSFSFPPRLPGFVPQVAHVSCHVFPYYPRESPSSPHSCPFAMLLWGNRPAWLSPGLD